MSSSVEVLALLIATVLGFPLPLLALQLLWVNAVTDELPALALSIDPPDIDIMIRPARDPKESVFTGRIKKMIFGIGILMPLAILPVFYLYNPVLTGTPDAPTPEYIHAMTMAFRAMV